MWLSGVSVASHQVSTQQQMSAYQNIVFSVVYSSECTVTWPAEVADWDNRCKNLQKVFLTCCLIVSNPTNLHLRIVRIDWNKLQQQKSGWKKNNKSSKKEFNNNKHFVYFSKALLCWISSRAVINHASSNCFFSSTSGGRGIDYFNYNKELLTAHETVSV